MLNVDDIMLHRTYDAMAESDAALITVYPNPTIGTVRVEGAQNITHYELYSITGAMVLRRDVDATRFDVDLSKLPAGTYLLKTYSEGLTQTQRLIKR